MYGLVHCTGDNNDGDDMVIITEAGCVQLGAEEMCACTWGTMVMMRQ